MGSSHVRWISEAGTHVELRMASLTFVSSASSHIGVMDSFTDGMSVCLSVCLSVCI